MNVALTNRRTFLKGAAIVTVAPFLQQRGRSAPPESTTESAAGLIVRENEPLNLEYPFSRLKEFVTPTNEFFVRSHFSIPSLDPQTWKLEVGGAVQQPFALTLDELRSLPSKTVTATIECAGNGRVFLAPKAKGVQWELGAVSNASWTGVSLHTLLTRAGLSTKAVEVILSGADEGEITEEPKSPGRICFERSLPLSKATSPDVLLVYEMNGAALPPEHGYPLRVVVPGWFGMASVKWLKKITVVEQPYLGYWQTLEYSYFESPMGHPELRQVTRMQVKSSIARPASGEVVSAGTSYRVFGAAWSGESDIRSVEISVDGGQSWQSARLIDEPVPNAWRFWEFNWQVPSAAGTYPLLCRATDAAGNIQPDARDRGRRGYLINHIIPRAVRVA